MDFLPLSSNHSQGERSEQLRTVERTSEGDKVPHGNPGQDTETPMQEQSSKLSEQGKGFQDNYPPVYNSFTDYVNSQMSTIGRARSWQDQKSLFGMRINPKKLPGERKVNLEQTSFFGDLKEFINDMQLGLGGDGNNESSTYCPFHGYNCYCILRPQSRIGFQGNVTQMSDANMGAPWLQLLLHLPPSIPNWIPRKRDPNVRCEHGGLRHPTKRCVHLESKRQIKMREKYRLS
ncbi:unnamed protein product [Ilex paraguariensis]|uniref:Uncharacterized protein n=1 Tax=Ilex paraguariensis TaxID=185542 RepID=A0ABC8TJV7_9AQUA